MKDVPDRFCAKCEFCKNELDTREDGTSQFTSGWVKQRSGGGGHGVSLAKRENRWAHSYCVERAAQGYSQTSMF
jgi:hypothetical protein